MNAYYRYILVCVLLMSTVMAVPIATDDPAWTVNCGLWPQTADYLYNWDGGSIAGVAGDSISLSFADVLGGPVAENSAVSVSFTIWQMTRTGSGHCFSFTLTDTDTDQIEQKLQLDMFLKEFHIFLSEF